MIVEKKVDTSDLVKKADYNAEITEIEGKIPKIPGLATTAAFNAVESKIPRVSNLVKKTNCNEKHHILNQILRLNILPYLITTSLLVKYSIQR